MCMNVAIDAQFSTSMPNSTENVTTTYKPATGAQSAGAVSQSGYIPGIANQVMDNEAYKSHGMTADEIMQQAENANVNVQKDYLIVMSGCVSGEDLQKMQEEGFHSGSTDVETYVTIVDKIKATLAQAGVEVAGFNDDLDVEKLEEITGSRSRANALAGELSQALQKSDMPVTDENVEELVQAVMEASGLEGISEDVIKYLVINQKAPTIENIYKAQYSGTESIRQAQGYYSDGAGSYGKYYAKKAQDINWDHLKGQLEHVVAQAGLDTDGNTKAQAVENARWMVESGIELNPKNLTMVTDLKNLSFPMEQSKLVELCVTAMENGKAPAKTDLTGEMSVTQQARELVEEAASISDEAVHEVAQSGEELTLKNLAAAQKQIDQQAAVSAEGTAAAAPENGNTVNGMASAAANADAAALREAEAKRQLEEIRLMMTEEANRHLLKSGISVDTTELSKLVEALKAAEADIKAALFKGDSAEENALRAVLYEETLTKTKELGQMPAAVLGKIVSGSQSYTLLRLHEEGKELQDQLGDQDSQRNPNQGQQKQAADAYETLMTAPRKDLGDKISKAFRNVDDILADMDLETSDANRRAVRILGYNRMEITEENINAVKAADSQVQGVISRMTPAATLQMIREQKNPLEMTMEELEDYLSRQDADPAADAEKYAKFLQRLDRTGGISGEEREAYIGIYRMFRQIEKSDGAVIGSIISTGAEMNFKNMLSAVRTAADKNMDIRVDDGFGALENLIAKGKAIDDQINAGYQNQAGSGTEHSDTSEQEKYYARLSGEINDELAEKTDLAKLHEKDISGDTTIEKFAEDIKTAQVSENERVLAEEKTENLKNFQRAVHEVEQVDDLIIETLIDFGQSVSVDNIQAASMLLFERGSLFRKAVGQDMEKADSSGDPSGEEDAADSSIVENEVLRQADRFVEQLNDAKQANASYQELIAQANKAVEGMIYNGAASQIDLKAARSLYKGLSLAGNLAREENYEVPMNIRGEITSVNLKIYHNAAQTGKVAVTMDTESLGRVAAEFSVTADKISGMVVYDNRQEKTALGQLEESLRTELAADGRRKVNISLVHAKTVDLNKFGEDRAASSENDKISTAELYQTAKAFLTALRGL